MKIRRLKAAAAKFSANFRLKSKIRRIQLTAAAWVYFRTTDFRHHHHHHLEIYSAPITFAAIGAVQKSYEQQQTLTNVKSKGKIMGF